MKVVILCETKPGIEKPWAVMHCGVESLIPGVLPAVKCYQQMACFATNEEAIEWCQENGHTIVVDAIAEAEE